MDNKKYIYLDIKDMKGVLKTNFNNTEQWLWKWKGLYLERFQG